MQEEYKEIKNNLYDYNAEIKALIQYFFSPHLKIKASFTLAWHCARKMQSVPNKMICILHSIFIEEENITARDSIKFYRFI